MASAQLSRVEPLWGELKYLTGQEVEEVLKQDRVHNNGQFDKTISEITLKLNKIGTLVQVVNSTQAPGLETDDVGGTSSQSDDNNPLVIKKTGQEVHVSHQRAVLEFKNNNEFALEFDPNGEDGEDPASSEKSVSLSDDSATVPSAKEEYDKLSELLDSPQRHISEARSDSPVIVKEMTELNTDALVDGDILKQGAREPQPILFENMFNEVNPCEKQKQSTLQVYAEKDNDFELNNYDEICRFKITEIIPQANVHHPLEASVEDQVPDKRNAKLHADPDQKPGGMDTASKTLADIPAENQQDVPETSSHSDAPKNEETSPQQTQQIINESKADLCCNSYQGNHNTSEESRGDNGLDQKGTTTEKSDIEKTSKTQRRPEEKSNSDQDNQNNSTDHHTSEDGKVNMLHQNEIIIKELYIKKTRTIQHYLEDTSHSDPNNLVNSTDRHTSEGHINKAPKAEHRLEPKFQILQDYLTKAARHSKLKIIRKDGPKESDIPVGSGKDNNRAKINILQDISVMAGTKGDIIIDRTKLNRGKYLNGTPRNTDKYPHIPHNSEDVQITQNQAKSSNNIHTADNKENISINQRNGDATAGRNVDPSKTDTNMPENLTCALGENINDQSETNIVETKRNVSDASEKSGKNDNLQHIVDNVQHKIYINTPLNEHNIIDILSRIKKADFHNQKQLLNGIDSERKKNIYANYNNDTRRSIKTEPNSDKTTIDITTGLLNKIDKTTLLINKQIIQIYSATQTTNISENMDSDKNNNTKQSIEPQHNSDDDQEKIITNTPRGLNNVSDILDKTEESENDMKKKLDIISDAERKKSNNDTGASENIKRVSVKKEPDEIKPKITKNVSDILNNDTSASGNIKSVSFKKEPDEIKPKITKNVSDTLNNDTSASKNIKSVSFKKEPDEINPKITKKIVSDMLIKNDKISNADRKKINDNDVLKYNAKIESDTETSEDRVNLSDNEPKQRRIMFHYSSDEDEPEYINTNRTKKFLKRQKKNNIIPKYELKIQTSSKTLENMGNVSVKYNKPERSLQNVYYSTDEEQTEINANRAKKLRRKVNNCLKIYSDTSASEDIATKNGPHEIDTNIPQTITKSSHITDKACLIKKKKLGINSDAHKTKTFGNDHQVQTEKYNTKHSVKTYCYYSEDEQQQFSTNTPKAQIKSKSDLSNKNDKTKKEKISNADQKKKFVNVKTENKTARDLMSVSNKTKKQEKTSNKLVVNDASDKLVNAAKKFSSSKQDTDDEQVKTTITENIKISKKRDSRSKKADNKGRRHTIAGDIKKANNRGKKVMNTSYKLDDKPKKTLNSGGNRNQMSGSGKESKRTDLSHGKSIRNGNSCEIAYGTQDEDNANEYKDVKETVQLSSNSGFVQIDGVMFEMTDFIGGVLAPSEPKQDVAESKPSMENTGCLKSAQLRRKVLSMSSCVGNGFKSLQKTHRRFKKYIVAMKKDASMNRTKTNVSWKDMRMLKMLQTIMVRAMRAYRTRRADLKLKKAERLKRLEAARKKQEQAKTDTRKYENRSIIKTEDVQEKCPDYLHVDRPSDAAALNYFRPDQRIGLVGDHSPPIGIRASLIRSQNLADGGDEETKEEFPDDIIRLRKRKLFCKDSPITDIRSVADYSSEDDGSWSDSPNVSYKSPFNRKYNLNLKRLKTLRSYNKK